MPDVSPAMMAKNSPPRDPRKPPAELRLGHARRGPANIPRGTPARVLVLFTLLTSMVVVSTWRDALQAAHVTGVRYPTALGDTQYFQPGTVVKLMGYEWEATREVLARGEDAMFRLETAADSAISIFTDREILPEASEPKIYAHTGPDEFLRLKPHVQGHDPAALPDAALGADMRDPFGADPGNAEAAPGGSAAGGDGEKIPAPGGGATGGDALAGPAAPDGNGEAARPGEVLPGADGAGALPDGPAGAPEPEPEAEPAAPRAEIIPE